MPLHLANVTLDCDDPTRVAQFWSGALERPLDPDGNEYFQSVGATDGASPRWLFLKVPEPKTAKNRMHLDLTAPDREVEVKRLLALGAERVDDHDEYGTRWTVMRDPEGNEFCVAAGPH